MLKKGGGLGQNFFIGLPCQGSCFSVEGGVLGLGVSGLFKADTRASGAKTCMGCVGSYGLGGGSMVMLFTEGVDRKAVVR